jgi:hypothetical protein
MLDETFISGKAGGTGDGDATLRRDRRGVMALMMDPASFVAADSTIWNSGRQYVVDAMGRLIEVTAVA